MRYSLSHRRSFPFFPLSNCERFGYFIIELWLLFSSVHLGVVSPYAMWAVVSFPILFNYVFFQIAGCFHGFLREVFPSYSRRERESPCLIHPCRLWKRDGVSLLRKDHCSPALLVRSGRCSVMSLCHGILAMVLQWAMVAVKVCRGFIVEGGSLFPIVVACVFFHILIWLCLFPLHTGWESVHSPFLPV